MAALSRGDHLAQRWLRAPFPRRLGSAARAGLLGLWILGGLLAVEARADVQREKEPNDGALVAQALVPAGSVGGAIDPAGDIDLFAFQAEAGQTIRVDILARGFRAGNQPGSQLSAVLEILDTDGLTILAADQSQGDFDDPAVSWT